MRPFVVVEGRSGPTGRQLAVALAAARREGWQVVRGWAAPLGPERVVCTGRVRSTDDARRALLAAVAGAALVVRASADRETTDRFLDDLRRLGPVEHVVEETSEAPPPLSDGQLALLGLLAEGLTIREAAQELRVALRTASRRLAGAREALGVASTAEAIVAAMARDR